MSEEAGPSVFISYSRRDDGTARVLHQTLEAAGCVVYRDEESIPVASKWRDELALAIESNDVFVFLMSPRSVGSKECSREVGHADENGKRIVPVVLEACDASRVPAALSERNYLFLRESDDFEAAIAALLDAIRTDLDWMRFHSELAVQAARWERESDSGYLFRGAELTAAGAWLEHPEPMTDPSPTALQLRFLQASKDEATREEERIVLRHVAEAYRLLDREPLRALEHALRALETRDAEEARAALADAQAVALQRLDNRRQEAVLDGRGVGYLMSRWREGSLFSRLSPDGRHLLIATERGVDGAKPPGDVYLLSLGTLIPHRLEPGGKAQQRRVEFVGFSLDTTRVFVCRQFYLDIYDLDGRLVNSTQLEFHAKPVHLIAGMFGSYVLAADTVGHVMMADTESDDRPQLEGAGRGNAALRLEASPDGQRALLLFEEGQAHLLDLADPTHVEQTPLPIEGVRDVAFDSTSDRFLTATRDGEVLFWSDASSVETRFSIGAEPVEAIAFAEGGERLVTLSVDATGEARFHIWEIETGRVLRTLVAPASGELGIEAP